VSSVAQPIKEDYTQIYNIAPLGYNVTAISKFQTVNGRNITTSQRNAEDLTCSQLSELDGLVMLYGTPTTNHLLKDCFSEEKVACASNLKRSHE